MKKKKEIKEEWVHHQKERERRPRCVTGRRDQKKKECSVCVWESKEKTVFYLAIRHTKGKENFGIFSKKRFLGAATIESCYI